MTGSSRNRRACPNKSKLSFPRSSAVSSVDSSPSVLDRSSSVGVGACTNCSTLDSGAFTVGDGNGAVLSVVARCHSGILGVLDILDGVTVLWRRGGGCGEQASRYRTRACSAGPRQEPQTAPTRLGVAWMASRPHYHIAPPMSISRRLVSKL